MKFVITSALVAGTLAFAPAAFAQGDGSTKDGARTAAQAPTNSQMRQDMGRGWGAPAYRTPGYWGFYRGPEIDMQFDGGPHRGYWDYR